MSDKLFDIFLVVLIVFIMGAFTGEHIACKKMGLKYSWDHGTCKRGGVKNEKN